MPPAPLTSGVVAAFALVLVAGCGGGAVPERSSPQPTTSGAASEVPRATAAERPNIVFLFSDDHAAHALSAYREHLGYGARLPETPNLDELASQGMLFTNAFVTNSICGPSRAAVLTGQYGHLNGVMTNGGAMHPTNETFPSLLQDGGYATALFGKWHLNNEPEGFDHYEILRGQGPYYNPVLITGSDTVEHTGYTTDIVTERGLRWLDRRLGTSGAASGAASTATPAGRDPGVAGRDPGVAGRDPTPAGRDPGAAGGDADQPFLLMLHYNASHRYWDPGPEELALYRDEPLPEPATLFDDGEGRASPFRLQEMEVGLDLFDRDLKLEAPVGLTPEQAAAWEAAYGRENAALRSLGDRAAVGTDVRTRWNYQRYMGDYMRTVAGLDRAVGEVLAFLEARGLADNTIVVYTSDQGFFLGDHGWFDKRWMYEESLRTPLLVRWPGAVEAGAVNRDLVMTLDLAQTLLELGGVQAGGGMQGRSLVPLLRGQRPADWRDAIYYQYFAYPDWHMVHRQYGVRTDRYKLIHYYEIGEWELFDLARDPNELNSVYHHPEYQDVVDGLERRLAELREEYAVPGEDPVPHTPFEALPELRRPDSLQPPVTPPPAGYP